MPKIAFSTLACPTWDFEQIVTAGIRDGYDGVEIRQVGGETDLLTVPAFDRSRRGASREFLKRARTSAGSRSFSICGLASSVRFDYPQESERDAQFSIGKAYVELAAELEAGFVRVFGDVLPASSKSASSKPVERELALDQVADGLNRLGDFAAPHEIDILLETHGDFADSRAVKDLFGRINSPRVGVLWDTHHPWRFYEESPESTFTNLKPWIRHTHWKDSVTLPHEAAATNSVSDAEQGAVRAHERSSPRGLRPLRRRRVSDRPVCAAAQGLRLRRLVESRVGKNVAPGTCRS